MSRAPPPAMSPSHLSLGLCRDKAPAEVVAESEAQLAALQRTLGRLAEAREIAKEL